MALMRCVALGRRSPLFALEKLLLGDISFSSMTAFLSLTSRGSCNDTREVREGSSAQWMAAKRLDVLAWCSLLPPR